MHFEDRKKFMRRIADIRRYKSAPDFFVDKKRTSAAWHYQAACPLSSLIYLLSQAVKPPVL
jgi:hypothetical protein